MAHIPVLLQEVLEYLDPKPGDNFIDCTVGEGGHALAILRMTAPHGVLLGIDRDADMVKILLERAEHMGLQDRLLLHHGNFSEVGEIAHSHNFSQVQGILFDFGLSSWQLMESGAGFSFLNIEPLDMRFDRSRADMPTAAHILNTWPEKSIQRVIREFGEERYAGRIAKAIVMYRKRQKIDTTDTLVQIISKALPNPKGYNKIHFATRTFQALRIAVNTELESIKEGLEEAIELLGPCGRIAAISFHSLEDRIVKNIFKEGSPRLKIITKKPLRPTPEELKINPRARSAKLRVARLAGLPADRQAERL